ncbi:hypothetical protein [Micromonospora aurantiaca]|uniref:hypothetical protein n=1 Tax=Micromonospora aurantiaca (nom. illeg.) TaxID=47850 RepID=UPI001476E601|nr:hypothetical protein [Micromonospora aurantiaca]
MTTRLAVTSAHRVRRILGPAWQPGVLRGSAVFGISAAVALPDVAWQPQVSSSAVA